MFCWWDVEETMKYDSMYMQIAERVAAESKCPRTRVGCVILMESGMTALGFNGHASGSRNHGGALSGR